jgi:hypothetical protein
MLTVLCGIPERCPVSADGSAGAGAAAGARADRDVTTGALGSWSGMLVCQLGRLTVMVGCSDLGHLCCLR